MPLKTGGFKRFLPLLITSLSCFILTAHAQESWVQADQWTQNLHSLKKKYPALKLQQIGHSRQNRPLWMASLGPENALRHGVWVCGQHGDEAYAIQLCSMLLHKALQLQQNDGFWQPFFRHMRISLIPLLNPDGLALKQRGNAAGVNLNANWESGAAFAMPAARRREFITPGASNYAGPQAFSEPETQALRTWLAEQRQIDLLIDVHNGLAPFSQGMVLFPLSAAPHNTLSRSDYQAISQLAQAHAAGLSLKNQPQSGFEALQNHQIPDNLRKHIQPLVPPEHLEAVFRDLPQNGQSPGSLLDWSYTTLGIPSLAYEIYVTHEDFSDARFNSFKNQAQQQVPALLRVMYNSLSQGVPEVPRFSTWAGE